MFSRYNEHVGELASGLPLDPSIPKWPLLAVSATRRTSAQNPRVASTFQAPPRPCLDLLPEET